MRIPSLVKLPRHRQFTYEPRYYNAQKEELDARVKVIESQIKEEQNPNDTLSTTYSNRMRQAFREQRHQPKSVFSGASGPFIIRAMIALVLVGGGYAFLEYGEKITNLVQLISASGAALWILTGLFFLYFFMRLRRR